MIIGSPGLQPIVLAPPNDLLALALCEGIETALSIHAATGLGVWAAAAANRLPTLASAIPSFVECITIYAETDHAGQRYSEKLAQALIERGGVEVLLAKVPQ